MRVLRRLRAGLPDRDADGKSVIEHRPARAQRRHHLRLLRRRLLVRAEMQGDEAGAHGAVDKDGKANRGHSCVKGRFAWGYATHKDRITTPMIRESITDPWREVSWDEAIAHTAVRVQAHPGQYGAARSAASPRRAAPTRKPTSCRSWCARRSATTTSTPARASAIRRPATASRPDLRQSAGTQDFDSVEQADVILVIGANPTDGHPVFASRMKKRLRQGAKLIVVDPRRIDLVRSPHVEAAHHLRCARHQRRRGQRAGACHRHRGPVDEASCASAATGTSSPGLARVHRRPENSPEALEKSPACRPPTCAPRRGCYATGGNGAIYYGLGVTEHSQGSTMVMGIANLAMATGNIGRPASA
jgi:formate dehydrogenase major subunit